MVRGCIIWAIFHVMSWILSENWDSWVSNWSTSFTIRHVSAKLDAGIIDSELRLQPELLNISGQAGWASLLISGHWNEARVDLVCWFAESKCSLCHRVCKLCWKQKTHNKLHFYTMKHKIINLFRSISKSAVTKKQQRFGSKQFANLTALARLSSAPLRTRFRMLNPKSHIRL